MERVCREQPADHEAWLILGQCLLNIGSLDRAIESLNHALMLKPDFTGARVKLGYACFQKGWIGHAIESLREALCLDRGCADAHYYLIKALLAAAQYHEAVDACVDAFSVLPATADLHCQHAVALEQTNRLDEARVAVNASLNIDPEHVRANLVMAKLDKRYGNLELARARLERELRKGLPPVQAATLGSELGDVLDRMGEYGAAYHAFEMANNVLASTVTPAQAAQEPVFDKIDLLIKWFSRNTTQHWKTASFKNDRSSPIFLVGFPRSGTTLTEQMLASLNQIRPSDEKPILDRLLHELPGLLSRPFSYPQDLNTLSGQELEELRARYWMLAEEMVGPLGKGGRLLDKMPFNIIDLGMVYRLFPDAKIIVVLRDPRDCCISCFMQPFMPSQTNIHLMSLEGSVKLYAAVMQLWLLYRSSLEITYLEVSYESMVADFERMAKRVVRFIDEPWDDAVLRYYDHSRARNVSTPSYSGVAAPIYSGSIGRWEHYRGYFGQFIKLLDPSLDAFGYKRA